MRHAVVIRYYTDIDHSSNDDWTTRADEAVSRVNGNIDLLSSAVRTFISQRNLTSLEEAIKNEKDPYDGLQYELDDTIDSLHRKRQPIRTVQNEAKDQNRTLPIGLYESSQRKSDKIISSSFDGAASLDDNVDAPEDTSDSKDANIISLHNENYRNSKDSTDLAWKRHNLLSLGYTTFSPDFLIMLTTALRRRRRYPWILVPFSAQETHGKHRSRGGKNC